MQLNGIAFDWLQIAVLLVIVTLLIKPLGSYLARVYQGERTWLSLLLSPLEKGLYRAAGIQPDREMAWKEYALAMLIFNGLGLVVLFAILMLQGWLPLNPEKFPGFSWDVAINAAVSFTTNTNWQFYSGESAASYFTQV
jgi:K+-transporting ATPase ATPase A chain